MATLNVLQALKMRINLHDDDYDKLVRSLKTSLEKTNQSFHDMYKASNDYHLVIKMLKRADAAYMKVLSQYVLFGHIYSYTFEEFL